MTRLRIFLLVFVVMGSRFSAQNKMLDSLLKVRAFLITQIETGGENNAELLKQAMHCEEKLSDAYTAANDHKKAYDHFKRSVVYKDRVFTNENTRQTVKEEMRLKREKQKLNERLDCVKKELLAAQLKRKQILIIAFTACAVTLFLVLAIIIYRSLKQNQKKNEMIIFQKQLIETQKQVVEEKQKEIIDSIHYAKRIQQSLITPENYIHRTISRLKDKT